jgi:hypothetical protein
MTQRTLVVTEMDENIYYQSINDRMTRIAPVLSSKFAKYPMQFSTWLDPFTQTKEGKPTFMPQEHPPRTPPHEGDERYIDYIWGDGPCGKGYYHLLTKQAYKNLIDELENETPVIRCDCFVGDLGQLHDHMEVVSLLRHRSESDVPNDFEIARKINDTAQLNMRSTGNPCRKSKKIVSPSEKRHFPQSTAGSIRSFTKNIIHALASIPYPPKVQQPLEP